MSGRFERRRGDRGWREEIEGGGRRSREGEIERGIERGGRGSKRRKHQIKQRTTHVVIGYSKSDKKKKKKKSENKKIF